MMETDGLQLDSRSFNLAMTGVTPEGFEEPVNLTRELPEKLVDVLSRLVVLRAKGTVEGPLEALIPPLPVHGIRVLDLAGCRRLTGAWVK